MTRRRRMSYTRRMTTGGSILSFPDRGPWGDAGYRGNCSGYVYQEIFEVLHPRVFTDPMVGGGTSVDVARAVGIEAHGSTCFRASISSSSAFLTLYRSRPTW